MRLNKKEISFKALRVLMALSFLSGTIGLDLMGARPAYSEPLNLPAINQFVTLSDTYSFPVLKGLRFDPANPLTLEFIVDTADQKDVSQEEASSLIKYFLAALTIPEEEIWVNLSPYEQDKVIPENLGQTDLGKGLLSQDYVLKQLTSSLTYPESDTGKDYWERTYAEVLKIAKTTNLPVSTFNKIWIVPDKAQVYENENIAVISEASLKAMLEEDYLALQNKAADIRKEKKNLDNETIEKINKAASEVMKETILPQINRDINSGKNFAALRQIYHSLILGIWFKKKFQDSLYAHYINKGMIKGIDLEDKAVKDKIYNHYVEAFKSGLYNYVKTDYNPGLKKNLKRRYYSGGFSLLGDGSGGSLSWFQPEEKSPSYIASMLRIEGPAQSLVVKLEGSNAPEVVDEQGEVIASAASPISAEKKGDGKTFKDAVKQRRKTVFVVSSSDSDVETMEEFIGDLLRRIEENPLLRNSAIRAAAIAAFPYSDNLQLLKEVSDRLKISGVSSELARLAVHYAPGIEKAEDVGEVFRKLKDLGVEYIIFDSRGQPSNDKSLNSAVLRAIEKRLKPIIVVGEKGEKDENPYATVVVADQLKAITKGVSAEIVNDMVIAYQPLGLKPFDAGQVVLTHIREIIFQLYGYEAASNIRILYGAENDISSVVNRKSDIDGVFSTRTSPMHGLYSGYIFTEFLRRRFEGSSSSPLADAGGGAEAREEKVVSSAASPIRPDGVSGGGKDSSGRSGKSRRTPIIATRLFGDEITVEGSVRLINEMLNQRIGGGKTLQEFEPGNLEAVVLAELSLAHLQAMNKALKASGIPSGLVSLAAQDMPAYGMRHLENLKSVGVEYVVIKASNENLHASVKYVFRAGMKPIIVAGETRDQRFNGTALSTVRKQVYKIMWSGISEDRLKDVVIAYQPPYKIRPDEAAWIQLSIRNLIRDFDKKKKFASAVRIIFSGDVSVVGDAFKSLLKTDGVLIDNRARGMHFANIAEKFLEDRKSGSSSPLATGGAEAQESSIATQPWRKGGIDMQGIDVGTSAGSSAPLFDSGFDLRNFSGFTFKIVAINEIDDFDSLVSQPRNQEKKLTSISSPSA